jgi:hypothetical protein
MNPDHSAAASASATIDRGPRASAILKARENLFVTLNGYEKVHGAALARLQHRLHD